MRDRIELNLETSTYTYYRCQPAIDVCSSWSDAAGYGVATVIHACAE
jgi:hypothetical protein